MLSDKIILAWILKYSVHEFKDSSIEEIKGAIEETPEISVVPVYPGKTPEMIIGMADEDKIPNEGEMRYDIRFTAFTPTGERVKLIINIEAQKSIIQDMICLGNPQETSGDNPLTNLLSVLLSNKMGVDEKETCLYDNFGIETSIEIKEGLTTMCNLSYGIAEEAEQKGREEGREKIIL